MFICGICVVFISREIHILHQLVQNFSKEGIFRECNISHFDNGWSLVENQMLVYLLVFTIWVYGLNFK